MLFGPPALLGAVLWQYFFVANRVRSPIATIPQDAAESALLEHASLVGQTIYNTAVTLLAHSLGVGSAYLFATSAVSNLLALIVNDYILRRKSRGLHLMTYVIGQARSSSCRQSRSYLLISIPTVSAVARRSRRHDRLPRLVRSADGTHGCRRARRLYHCDPRRRSRPGGSSDGESRLFAKETRTASG